MVTGISRVNKTMRRMSSELPVRTKQVSDWIWLIVGSGRSQCSWLLLIFVLLLLWVVLLGTARLLIAGTVVESH